VTPIKEKRSAKNILSNELSSTGWNILEGIRWESCTILWFSNKLY